MSNSPVHTIGNAELQLIQATLRVDEERDAALNQALQLPLDWGKLQSLAMRHGVLPLVYQRLQQLGIAAVPTAARQQMALWQKANELRVAQMTADLVKIVRALEAEDIPVLCLKGPVLATVLYGDPALRAFGDLDILVSQRDYTRATVVLSAIGAMPAYPDRTVSLEMHRHDSFLYSGSLFELHWNVTTRNFPRALTVERLFARNQQVCVYGEILATLGAEDILLHACQHGTQHNWRLLRYQMDVAAAWRAVDVDQSATLLESASGQGLARPLLVATAISSDYLGLPLPAEFMNHISRDKVVRWSIGYIRANFFRFASHGTDYFDMLMLNLLLSESHMGWIVPLLGSMFTPSTKDYQWVSLPKRLRWLYPLLRPLRWMTQSVAMIVARQASYRAKL